MKTLLLALALILIPQVCFAEILWDYSSTDGFTTLSGQLTSSGDPADLAAPNHFTLVSILSAFVNGGPISTWGPSGGVPPFTGYSTGSFDWDTVQASMLGGYLEQTDHSYINSIRIAEDGSWTYRTWVYRDEFGDSIVNFEPTVTTITPADSEPVIPEPSTIALLAVGLLGIGVYATRKRRQR